MLAALDALPVPRIDARAAPARRAVEEARTVASTPGARRRPPLAAIGAAAAALLVLVVVVVALASSEDAEEVAGGSETTPAAPVPPRGDTPATPAEAPARPVAPPQAGRDPSPIADIRAALEDGRRPGRDADRRLIAHALSDREDPEPNLLLARIYLARGWRSDAIEQYEIAHAKDPRVCDDDPVVIDDLLSISIHPSIGWRAAAAVERICGATAIPVIDGALESPEIEPDAAARLRALRERLTR
jgi:hypothetical protein